MKMTFSITVKENLAILLNTKAMFGDEGRTLSDDAAGRAAMLDGE